MAFYQDLKDYENDAEYPNKLNWVVSRLLTLRHDLNETIKKDRKPNSLIIGSWNIRAFDGGVKRMDESNHYIAEIIDHFDICAIQEVKSDLTPLKNLVDLLGPNWEYFVSDISTHKGGNSERMAFLFNTNKVFFRNLIGEVVLAKEDLIDDQQIARTPYFASFQSGWFKFSLCSAHIIYGDDLAKRAAEIRAISNALIKRAKSEDQVHIFLGDMNIEKKDGIAMKALKESGLTVPEFGATNMAGDMWFDHIAFAEKGKASRKTKLLRHGKFDWRHSVFGPHPNEAPTLLSKEDEKLGKSRLTLENNLKHYEDIVTAIREENKKDPYKDWSKSYRRWTTDEMSDHLPIWVELEVDYSNEYLGKLLSD